MNASAQIACACHCTVLLHGWLRQDGGTSSHECLCPDRLCVLLRSASTWVAKTKWGHFISRMPMPRSLARAIAQCFYMGGQDKMGALHLMNAYAQIAHACHCTVLLRGWPRQDGGTSSHECLCPDCLCVLLRSASTWVAKTKWGHFFSYMPMPRSLMRIAAQCFRMGGQDKIGALRLFNICSQIANACHCTVPPN